MHHRSGELILAEAMPVSGSLENLASMRTPARISWVMGWVIDVLPTLLYVPKGSTSKR